MSVFIQVSNVSVCSSSTIALNVSSMISDIVPESTSAHIFLCCKKKRKRCNHSICIVWVQLVLPVEKKHLPFFLKKKKLKLLSYCNFLKIKNSITLVEDAIHSNLLLKNKQIFFNTQVFIGKKFPRFFFSSYKCSYYFSVLLSNFPFPYDKQWNCLGSIT